MAKLVVLSAGMTGRTCELNVDRVTIGRVDDNTFPITEPSVSSHHCEVLLRGGDVVVKDLNSTNGTFINGDKISEAVLKSGQILKLGQIELRLETDTPAPSKKVDQTMVVPRGVSLTDLEKGPRTSGFDTTSKAFSKKSGKANRWFWVVGGIVLVGIVVALGILIYSIQH